MLTRSGAIVIAAVSMMWSGVALADSCRGAFSGAYIGASVGVAGLDSDHSPLNRPRLSGDDHSAALGGFAGYNFQCGRVVFGAEADISSADLDARTELADPSYLRSSVDWFASLRGRLGVTVHDNLLIYATTGIAFADRTHWVQDPTAPGGTFTQSNSDTAHGWVIGGGAELMTHGRFSIRAEALWVDLGKEHRTYTVANVCGGPCQTTVDWKDQYWTARIGLAIKLGSDEPRYEPLK